MATVCADSEFHYPVVIGGGGWERRWTRRRVERQRGRGEEAAEVGAAAGNEAAEAGRGGSGGGEKCKNGVSERQHNEGKGTNRMGMGGQ